MNLSPLKLQIANIRHDVESQNSNAISIIEEEDKTICVCGDERVIVPMVKLRPYQEEPRDLIVNRKINRIFRVMPRRSGKEVESWQILIECAIRNPGSYAIIYPELTQGKKIIWNGGITLENGDMVKFLDMIPSFLVIGKPNSTDMTIKLWNGSIIQVLGSDKGIDKQRGTNFIGVVFSEFAYQDPRTYQNMMPVFRQNKGWAFLQTTYKGINHAYNYMKSIQTNKSWFTSVESAKTLVDEEGNRYVTEAMIQEDRDSGMAEFLILQEYFNIVSLNEESMYFAKPMSKMMKDGRIKENTYIPGLPVFSACDLGHHDDFVLLLFQLIDYVKPVIIWSTSGNQKPYVYYLNEAKSHCTENNCILDTNFAPHDVANKNTTSTTPLKEARSMGFTVMVTPKPVNKLVAISDMSSMLYNTTIDKACTHLVNCLSSYEKEFDEKMNVYKNIPVHNWASHGVDAFQTLTIAVSSRLIPMNDFGIVSYRD